MSSVLYLLRHPTRTLPTSLYLPDSETGAALGIETAVATATPAEPAKVLCRGDSDSLIEGEKLTYQEMLGVLLTAQKVITL